MTTIRKILLVGALVAAVLAGCTQGGGGATTAPAASTGSGASPGVPSTAPGIGY
jgi:hypothetical protein